MSQFKKLVKGQFVLKAAVAVIKNANKILLQEFGAQWILPTVIVSKGADYKNTLNQHLHSIGVSAELGRIKGIERVLFKSGKEQLRANFIIFGGTFKFSNEDQLGAAWFANLPKKMLLKGLV
jgi:hypothetical protein